MFENTCCITMFIPGLKMDRTVHMSSKIAKDWGMFGWPSNLCFSSHLLSAKFPGIPGISSLSCHRLMFASVRFSLRFVASSLFVRQTVGLH